MVYQALRGRMGDELHALALQTGAAEGYRNDWSLATMTGAIALMRVGIRRTGTWEKR